MSSFSPEERQNHAAYIASQAYTRMRDEVLRGTTVDLNNPANDASKTALMLAKADGIREAFANFEALGAISTPVTYDTIQPKRLIPPPGKPA